MSAQILQNIFEIDEGDAR